MKLIKSQKKTFLQYYSLNTVEKPQIFSAAFRSISGEEVARLMNSGTLEQFYSRYIIIDCRYPYEYRGGHIRVIIFFYWYFYDKEKFDEMSGKIPIFYCEYSQKRGPTAAEYLREIDRVRNAERYPRLDYEEIYVLDRGYKQFFEDGRFSADVLQKNYCSPFGYVRMFATPFRSTLAKYNSHRTRGNRYQPHTLKDRNKRLQNFLEQAEQSPLQFKRLRQSPAILLVSFCFRQCDQQLLVAYYYICYQY
uniref:protein-tyrosine-phosphatase n=1 Tax=Syphacia muris TaxID=451379 RepID=A0A0N5AYG0_9BILA